MVKYKKLLILILIPVLLASCFGSQKFKTNNHVQSDSSSVSNTHSITGSKLDSSNFRKTETTTTNGIQVIFDKEDTTALDLIVAEDATEKANDLAGTTPVKKKPIHTISINGNTINSSRGIAAVNITQQGSTITIDATKLQKNDSSNTVTNNNITVVKDIKSSNKDIKRNGPGMLFYGFIIVAGILIAGGAKKYLPIWFPKNNV